MDALLQPRKFRLVGAESYTSLRVGGVVRKGAEVVLPGYCAALFPHGVFQDVGFAPRHSEWSYSIGGGLGDKIYSIPAVIAISTSVGITKIDEPIFRLVASKVRKTTARDIPATTSLGDPSVELVDQLALRMGIADKLTMKMPVLQTTDAEKQTVLGRDPYVVLGVRSMDPRRDWLEGLSLSAKLDLPVVVLEHQRSTNYFPLIEQAVCVISCNTCWIPMAGAFQVPVIGVGSENRVGYFLDAVEVPMDSDAVLEAYRTLINKPRIKCWCGSVQGKKRIEHGIYVIRCAFCGTDRQDIKVSNEGLSKFYSDYYHSGWRELVEKESPYEDRFLSDCALSRVRLEQWGIAVGLSWLDVGGANFALSHVLETEGWKRVGVIEPSVSNENKHPRRWKSWDGVAGTFDVVSYIDVMEHVDVEFEMGMVSRHLNPGGTLILELPLAHEEPKHYRRLQHAFFFTEETAIAMVRHFGYEVVKVIHPLSGRLTLISRRV